MIRTCGRHSGLSRLPYSGKSRFRLNLNTINDFPVSHDPASRPFFGVMVRSCVDRHDEIS
jgi:hypothetical protein